MERPRSQATGLDGQPLRDGENCSRCRTGESPPLSCFSSKSLAEFADYLDDADLAKLAGACAVSLHIPDYQGCREMDVNSVVARSIDVHGLT
jgi:hypothetical protein